MKRSLKEMRSLLELHRYPGAEGHSLEFLAAAPEIVADLLATVQELREALEEERAEMLEVAQLTVAIADDHCDSGITKHLRRWLRDALKSPKKESK